MKFACPKCNTRYSISDDKVPPGKVLKFPCKTCGNVVRLRRKDGDQAQLLEGAPQSPMPLLSPTGEPVETTRIASVAEINKLRDQSVQPTRIGMQAVQRPEPQSDGGETTRIVSVEQINLLRAAAAEGDTSEPAPAEEQPVQADASGEPAEWFVLIAGKQRGPMTAANVDAMLSRNEIDRRTFLWKSGMPNWERLSTVERFAAATAPTGDAAATPAGGMEQLEPTIAEDAMERAAAGASDPTRRPTDEAAITDLEEVATGVYEESNGQPVAAADASEDITIADQEPEGFYKAQTMVFSAPSLGEGAAAGTPTGELPPDARRAETVELQEGVSFDGGPRATDRVLDAVAEGGTGEHGLGSFDDVSVEHPMMPSTDEPGMEQLGPNPNYLDAPPGDSTRVYMATAGIYKKRRNNRIAAVITTVLLLLVCGFIVMDMKGLIVLPGMGAVYEVAGVDDPNVDRALERTENKLAAEDLDPKKRAQLESLRRKLLDRSNGTESNGKPEKKDAKPAEQKAVTAPEGDKPAEDGEKPASGDEHAMAEQLFSDKEKQEANVKLAAPDSMQTPNLPAGLTQEAIYKVVNDNNTSMKLCYAEAARKGEKLAGKMEVQMTIDPSGDVSGADINTPEFKTSTMGQCTVRRVKTWKFPKFTGQPVTVVFPYVLQSAF